MVGLTLHETIDCVALELYSGRQKGRRHLIEHARVGCFERTKSVVELALAATATDGEVSRDAPLVSIIGKGEGGNKGCGSLALEPVGRVGILCVELEQGERGFDVTFLESGLAVEAQMPSVGEECTASRVGIDACDVNLAFLSEVTYEGCVLIGVGQETTGNCVTYYGQCHQTKKCFFHIYFYFRS